MSTPPRISLKYLALRTREQSHASRRRDHITKIGLGCSGLFSVLVALSSVVIALVYTNLTKDLPSIEALPALLESPDGLLLEPTKLFDRSGEHVLLVLQNPASSKRQYLRFSASTSLDDSSISDSSTITEGQLPHSLVVSTIAAADSNFWNHNGFSLSGITQNAHPTLAQRLVSDLLLYGETPSLRRAIRERLLAAQATSRFGREKILEWYLNSANYGRFAFGVDSAARLYFGKSATKLSLGEATLLAGVSESPSLNPLDAPRAAFERQKEIIQELLRYRLVTPLEGIQAAREDLIFSSDSQPDQGLSISQLEPQIAPAFAQWVIKQLEKVIPLDRIERGGLRVITTLDFDLQIQANCASVIQLERLKTSNVQDQTLTNGECLAGRLLPTLPSHIGGQENPALPSNLQSNVVVIDPLTNQILALVGDSPMGFESSPLPYHPAGSLITPFIYLAAFARGSSPATLVWDVPTQTMDASLPNIDEIYHGPLRLRIALANDYLIPAEKTLVQVGSENVLRIAQQLGILMPGDPDFPDSTSNYMGLGYQDLTNINSVLSTTENSTLEDYAPRSELESTTSILSLFRPVNIVEISQVFGILANQGGLVTQSLAAESDTNLSGSVTINLGKDILNFQYPPTILKVEDSSGRVWLEGSNYRIRPIITPQLAFLMTHALSDEAARWQSMGHPNALEIGRPAAAKLGRTPSGESNWTIGYTPQRLVGVWIGIKESQTRLNRESIRLLQDSTAGLWHALIQYTSRDLPYQAWEVPINISNIKVCDPSGMLPTIDCPNVVDEVFLAGNEPIQSDTLYRTLQVNRETGNMATMFTPSDLVEDRTYMIFPLEASQWAQQTGLDNPPDVFDLVPSVLPGWPGARIDSPSNFSLVRGKVAISGDASGDDFAFYRIQVGKGLFPKSWYQVGDDVSQPITGGTLATWDTAGLSGLYAIQLLVVRNDQTVERITTMVTIDNRPPEVQILYPTKEEEIILGQDNTIVLQVKVDDELGIESVKFTVDDQPFATITQPPFAISWSASSGIHTLQVLATDLAGNTSEAKVDFVVQ